VIPGHLVHANDWSWAFLGVWEEEKVRSRIPPEAGFGSPDLLHNAVCSVQVQDACCPPSACENMEEKRMDVDEDSRVWHADKRYVYAITRQCGATNRSFARVRRKSS
jgi:hypothetical protein